MSEDSRIRIWYQSMVPIGNLGGYRDALAVHARRACSDHVDVRFNFASDEAYKGLTPAELFPYPYAKYLIQQEVFGFAERAEAEGFDAFVLGSFSEPFLLELRSLLGIPVVSMPEATLLASCPLAERFALITLGPANVVRLRRVVQRHSLEGRISGFHHFAEQTNEAELNAAFEDPQPLIDKFTAVAQDAVKAGADLVIPAEGVLNEVLHANDVTSVSGATVMDCVGAGLLHSELMIALRRRLGIGVGRHWSYLQPPADVLTHLKCTSDQVTGER